jgi:CBS domain containing-hemolysin-like protein
MLRGAAKSGQVDSGEQEMIQNVLEMGETPGGAEYKLNPVDP